MPLPIPPGAPTFVIRRAAYERSGLVRSEIDRTLNLTDEEFRVDGDVVLIGPVYDDDACARFLGELERVGLTFYDDFFELSGNWPGWLSVLAGPGGVGRSRPSQPHE